MLHDDFIGNWEEEDSILFFSSSANQQIEKLLHRQLHLEKVSGQNIKALDPERHLAYVLWEDSS